MLATGRVMNNSFVLAGELFADTSPGSLRPLHGFEHDLRGAQRRYATTNGTVALNGLRAQHVTGALLNAVP